MGKTIPDLIALTAPADNDLLLINDTSASNASKKITYQDFTVGMTLQTQVNEYSTRSDNTTTSTIPYDDTIPQNTEGKEFMTVSITPKRANSRLRIRAGAMFSTSAKATVVMAIFRDSTANAISATAIECTLDDPSSNFMQVDVTAGSTTATTFRCRLGTTAGTLTFMGEGGNRRFGDIVKAFFEVTEIAQ